MGDDETRKLRQLVTRLYKLQAEIDRIEERKAVDRTQPFPPASETEITARERQLNFRFPPSYREFLKLHNGWRNLHNLRFIFGVSGPGYTLPANELRNSLNGYLKIFTYQGLHHATALQEKERTDPDVIYLPHHPVIAMDVNGLMMVLDRNRQTLEGEYQIALVESGQLVEERYRSFTDVLLLILRRTQSALADLGGKPNA